MRFKTVPEIISRFNQIFESPGGFGGAQAYQAGPGGSLINSSEGRKERSNGQLSHHSCLRGTVADSVYIYIYI